MIILSFLKFLFKSDFMQTFNHDLLPQSTVNWNIFWNSENKCLTDWEKLQHFSFHKKENIFSLSVNGSKQVVPMATAAEKYLKPFEELWRAFIANSQVRFVLEHKIMDNMSVELNTKMWRKKWMWALSKCVDDSCCVRVKNKREHRISLWHYWSGTLVRCL